jgi:hypothetical protein
MANLRTYEIYNVVLGEVLGSYTAETEDAALDEMARAFGFRDYADVVRDYGLTAEEGKAELLIVEQGGANG